MAPPFNHTHEKETQMKRNANEPRVKCPKCGDVEKESEYKVERGMCWRCWSYLSPKVGGKDEGFYMERVRTDSEGCRHMQIRPRGFWSEMVSVEERVTFWGNPAGTWTVNVSWGSGGTDGTLDEIRTASNFAIAVSHVVQVATKWKCERIDE